MPSAHSVLFNPDLFKLITAHFEYYSGHLLPFFSVSKEMYNAACHALQLSFRQTKSQRYLDDLAFRSIIHKRVKNEAQQISLKLEAKNHLDWINNELVSYRIIRDLVVYWEVAPLIKWDQLIRLEKLKLVEDKQSTARKLDFLDKLSNMQDLDVTGGEIDISKAFNLKRFHQRANGVYFLNPRVNGTFLLAKVDTL